MCAHSVQHVGIFVVVGRGDVHKPRLPIPISKASIQRCGAAIIQESTVPCDRGIEHVCGAMSRKHRIFHVNLIPRANLSFRADISFISMGRADIVAPTCV